MDTCVAMGASLGVGLGLRHVLPEKDARASSRVIGDSTFVHTGLNGLVEMVYNPPATGHVLIVLDNGTTAMTGQQEHPGTGRTLDHEPTGKRLDRGARARGRREERRRRRSRARTRPASRSSSSTGSREPELVGHRRAPRPASSPRRTSGSTRRRPRDVRRSRAPRARRARMAEHGRQRGRRRPRRAGGDQGLRHPRRRRLPRRPRREEGRGPRHEPARRVGHLRRPLRRAGRVAR